MNWADLFERGTDYETDVETIRETLASRRESVSAGEGDSETPTPNDDRREGKDV